MASDLPFCTRLVNSLPDHRIQLAALLGLFSMALFIESPVIDLLATSTALGKSKANFSLIRKFSLHLMLWCGVVHLIVAVTPLFDVVFSGILNLPKEVAEAIRLPMIIMLPWSPAIGWRRHLQGILISSGQTKAIGIGTFVRLVTIIAVCFGGFMIQTMPGAVVAASALTSSVVAEAVYIHIAGRNVVRKMVWQSEELTISTRDLVKFHAPLTVSTMVMLTSMPMTTRALNRSVDPLIAMNGWQVAMTLAFLLRTITFALPEVVIANWRPGTHAKILVRFCSLVGLSLTVLSLFFSLTGLDKTFFMFFAKADREVVVMAHIALLACCSMPFLGAITNYVKGVLTLRRITFARLVATLASVAVLALMLEIGVGAHWPGVVTAGLAVTASQLGEFVILASIYLRKGNS